MIYFTSDLHLGHNKDFIYKARGFENIEDHDEALINNWNDIVNDDDEVYILGDLMLGDNKYGIECLNRLKGKKYYIIGNHDTSARQKLYEKNDIECLGYSTIIKIHKYHFYLSHYATLTDNYDSDKPLTTRVINLYGHTHQVNRFNYEYKGCMMNIGVDANFLAPVSIDEVIKAINLHNELIHIDFS